MACSTAAVSSGLVVKGVSLASANSGISGSSVATVAAPTRVAKSIFAVRASKGDESDAAVSRRTALALVGAVLAAGSRIAPANAAYGESGKFLRIPQEIKELVWSTIPDC